MSEPVRVLFVCLGNICRSPTAHGVFADLVQQAGFGDRIEVDSSGTGDWHIGLPPDGRAVAEAKKRGYNLSHLRARQVCREDFELFDLILAMDRDNLNHLQALRPARARAELRLFLEFASDSEAEEVPDPYFGGAEGFAHVFELVEAASRGLLRHIEQHFSGRLDSALGADPGTGRR